MGGGQMGLFVSVGQRSWAAAILIVIVCALLCGALGALPATRIKAFGDDGHARASIALAASRAACPDDGRLRDQFTNQLHLASGPLSETLQTTPIILLATKLQDTSNRPPTDLCAQ